MKTSIKFILYFFFLYFSTSFSMPNINDSVPVIYKINIQRKIDSKTWIDLKKGLQKANELDAKYVILDINTYGGELISADSMRTAILNSKIPVIAFINNNAASAGALISIACDSIYMSKSATIGAASVVSVKGEIAPEKYQSYMRGIMRSTAESHGKYPDSSSKKGEWRRNPLIAESMVTPNISNPIANDSSQIVTLTTHEAIKYGFCEGEAKTINDIATHFLKLNEYKLKTHNPTIYDNLRAWLSNSFVRSTLILLILGGIYLELKTQGVGLPITVALCAAILFFLPGFLSGESESWGIVVFCLGLLLLVFEIFVIPGFGVAGILGIIAIIASLIMILLQNVSFSQPHFSSRVVVNKLFPLSISIVLLFLIILFTYKRISRGHLFKNLRLDKSLSGDICSDEKEKLNSMIGKEGYASSVLRPVGKVKINGKYYDAISLSGMIEQDEKIMVVKEETAQLYVKKI